MTPSKAVMVNAADLAVRIGLQVILAKAGLTIHEGECAGLAGRNGVDKSTLLRILKEGLLGIPSHWHTVTYRHRTQSTKYWGLPSTASLTSPWMSVSKLGNCSLNWRANWR